MKSRMILVGALAVVLASTSALASEPPAFAVAVDFAFKPSAPQVGEGIQFWAVFTGTPAKDTVVTWSFPDSPPVLGDSVWFMFKSAGKIPVEVVVSQPGLKPISESKVVEVLPIDDPQDPAPEEGAVAVTFQWTPSVVRVDKAVVFVPVFTGKPLSGSVLSWVFADGRVAEGDSVTHQFVSPGKWLVTLQLEQPGLKSIVDAQFVTVLDADKFK